LPIDIAPFSTPSMNRILHSDVAHNELDLPLIDKVFADEG